MTKKDIEVTMAEVEEKFGCEGGIMMEVAYGQPIKSCADLEKEDNIDDIKSRFEKYQKDNINPDHYKSETSLECIEEMEIIFGRDAVIDFCRCNAWKYIWRWKYKNGIEDLKKAKWYLERAYNMLDGNDKRIDIVRGMIHYVGWKVEESDD